MSVKIKIFRDCGISQSYIVMNALATIIASYGLLANNTSVIIGAMLLAMLLGPINGLAYSLAHGQLEIFKKSLFAEIFGVITVVSIAALIGYIHQDIPVSSEMLARTSPNIFDLMIALAGGAGSAYAMTSSRLAAAMGGVAIATAIVPPLATSGMLFARGLPSESMGAFMLFITNLLAISFSSMIVFFLRSRKDEENEETQSKTTLWIMRAITFGLLLWVSSYLWQNFDRFVQNQKLQRSVSHFLKAEFEQQRYVRVTDIWIENTDNEPKIYVVLRSQTPPSQEKVNKVSTKLEKQINQKIELHVRAVPVEEIISE